jgi:cytochrome c biogenesis protein ResB
VMPEPRPKKFRSELTILQDEKKKSISVEVNAPYNVGPYRLYQLSYDDKMGEASHYSVIEVVRDRSVPVVYAGMIALLLGVAMMMWQGVNSPMKGKQ